MKRYWFLAAFGFVCLVGAAVWLGGLNQDEGWYLCAANLVAEGEAPYRDFFFTQGPIMPAVYAHFVWAWQRFGLLGARIFTACLGALGIVFAVLLARRLVVNEKKDIAAVVVAFLLGCNLYHLYYTAIPKTYALAGLFVVAGFYLLSFCVSARCVVRVTCVMSAALLFAFAAGTRISLGAILAVVGLGLLIGFKKFGLSFLWFGIAGVVGLGIVYGVPMLDGGARAGFWAAQAYHASRGGFDAVFAVGSLSRLVRWYAPTFVFLGLGVLGMARGKSAAEKSDVLGLMFAGAVAVMVVQLCAPFPYEDYQVPVMGLLSVGAAVLCVKNLDAKFPFALLALGMTWALAFGSPLLEGWMVNGQDRFWSLKKKSCEMAQLRDVARRINELDPNGKMLLTQDLYLAIETNRKVPRGLEMGPFSYWGAVVPEYMPKGLVMDDAGMTALLASAPCEVAAFSGYAFAITAPEGIETPQEKQLDYFHLLYRQYDLAFREEAFGQNATTLLVLKRKAGVERAALK